jgi:hypothetical protein
LSGLGERGIGGGRDGKEGYMKNFQPSVPARRLIFRIIVSVALVIMWISYMLNDNRSGLPLPLIILWYFFLIAAVGLPIQSVMNKDSLSSIALTLIFSVVYFLAFFSALYWSYGTSSNFNVPLTHFDALYFALGTLSTAGTGTINATSELARGLQAAQMTLDLALVVFALGLVVARFTSSDN